MSLLRQVDRVYVMSSLMGLEARIAGCPSVVCFGVPFYAGWGLTDDRGTVPRVRGRRRSLEELFALAYLHYARYVDPETGRSTDMEGLLAHLTRQREASRPLRGRTFVCVGFSPWKRSFVRDFLRGPDTRVRFTPTPEAAEAHLEDAGATLVLWGERQRATGEALAARRGVELWRMEDGFLRSVGLGSDLHPARSLVLDRRGLYYDPSAPSDLEHLLQEAEFPPEELSRARALREAIVAARVSKYNVGDARPLRVAGGCGEDARPVALVIGQVEDDASVRLGAVDIGNNGGLLEAVRAARPGAIVLYRPHPDVTSGNRRGAVSPAVLARWADRAVPDATLADCLDAADEVHTITSLVGFEALLRGKDVHVYGLPFYAGWGLTRDRHPHPRRTRTRTLDELVAATLLRYPRYVHPESRAYASPEAVVRHLASAPRPGVLARSWVGRQVRKAVHLVQGGLRRVP